MSQTATWVLGLTSVALVGTLVMSAYGLDERRHRTPRPRPNAAPVHQDVPDLHTPRHRNVPPIPIPKRPQAEAESAAMDAVELAHGLELSDDGLSMLDWNAWMKGAVPDMLRASLQESGRDPQETVTNLFRRLFPTKPWPPPEDSDLREIWTRMIASTGRILERPFKPHLEIVS